MQCDGNIAKFEIQKININNNTNIIITLFQECIKKYNITELSLVSLTPEDRKGLKGHVLSFAEYVSGDLHGYSSISFPAAEVEIESSLKVLYDDYRTYINEIYERTGKTAGDTEKGNTDSRYVTVRELLLRAVVSAITLKSDLEHGNNMIQFINEFISKLIETQVLLNKKVSTENVRKGSIINTELSEFDIALSSCEHQEWMEIFSKGIEASNLIHLPKIAMTQASNYLKQLRHIIAAHILVISGFKLNEEADLGSFIQNTFQKFEYAIFEENLMADKHEKGNKKEILKSAFDEIRHHNWNTVNLTLSQKRIMSHFQENNELYIKLDRLYALFVNTNLLIQLTQHLCTMISGANWVLILSGYIDIANLNLVIREHSENCKADVFIAKEILEQHKGKLAYKALAKYLLLGKQFSEISACNTLSLLNKPEIIQKFLARMEETIQQLEIINTQIVSTFNYNIVNAQAGRGVFNTQKYNLNTNNKVEEKQVSIEFKSLPIDISEDGKSKSKKHKKNLKEKFKEKFSHKKESFEKNSSNISSSVITSDSETSCHESYSEISFEQPISSHSTPSSKSPETTSTVTMLHSASMRAVSKQVPPVPPKPKKDNRTFSGNAERSISPVCESTVSLSHTNFFAPPQKKVELKDFAKDSEVDASNKVDNKQIEEINRYKLNFLNDLKTEVFKDNYDTRSCCVRMFSSAPFIPPGIQMLRTLLTFNQIEFDTVNTFDSVLKSLDNTIKNINPNDNGVDLYATQFDEATRIRKRENSHTFH